MADVSSTTTAAPTMDVDPATTISSSGFIPPAVESGAPVVAAAYCTFSVSLTRWFKDCW